jgi:hypothetical protein
MSYLCYLCLLTYNGVQHILCCVFLCIVGLLRFKKKTFHSTLKNHKGGISNAKLPYNTFQNSFVSVS